MLGLWVIPTPIGNLADLTLRALEVLRSVDVLWCEDTRQARKLLHHYELGARPLRALHAHNEHRVLESLFAEATAARWRVGLLTDSGMPGISDPGYLPIQEAYRRGVPVYVLPGPTAFVTALIASGLPAHRFAFEGFFPRKGQRTYLQRLQTEDRTLIWYEAPTRLVRTLALLQEIWGPERVGCVARELTKLHEEVRRGTLAELYAHYAAHPPRGEVV
ncbi:MAG: 16S rRNA (cytidine(1402)-2'-O)-methyltransferase, partial [Bacteroidetes bacterium]